MKRINILILVAAMLFSATSCKKDGFLPFDSVEPEIPVTVTNFYALYNSATVAASAKDSIIKITLSIPAGSGRTIKEITRVAANTSYTSVHTTTGLYNTAPIAGSGTSVTFTTTFKEYTAKTTSVVPLPTATSALLTRYFFFMITLDNGQIIYPEYVKVIVIP